MIVESQIILICSYSVVIYSYLLHEIVNSHDIWLIYPVFDYTNGTSRSTSSDLFHDFVWRGQTMVPYLGIKS